MNNTYQKALNQSAVILEFNQLLKEYSSRWQNFNNANEDYIDTAIYELLAVEQKIDILRKQVL